MMRTLSFVLVLGLALGELSKQDGIPPIEPKDARQDLDIEVVELSDKDILTKQDSSNDEGIPPIEPKKARQQLDIDLEEVSDKKVAGGKRRNMEKQENSIEVEEVDYNAIKLEQAFDEAYSNDTDSLDLESLIPLSSNLDRATTQCGCGFSNANPASGRIVNGQPVQNHARPYQAFLEIRFGSSSFICGGTLVNKRYVITAMHCIENNGQLPSSTQVSLGLERRGETGSNIQTLSVERYIQRSDYSGNDNDIAILRLNADVQFNADVQPACLPTVPSRTYENQNAIVSGFGTTSYGGSVSSVLMEVTVRITPQSESTCRAYGNLPNSQMCAYTQGKDSCQGDSGGPLVVQEDGRNTLVGVVSYGRGCAFTGYAGVYARVTHFLDWINANIADGNCGSTTTTTTATNAPTTAPPSPNAPMCDLTCTNVGSLSGNWYLNGILSTCNNGMCFAVDGSDLCQSLNLVGFCNSQGTTATAAPTTTTTTTTTPAPTTTTSAASQGPWCRLRCIRALRRRTGYFRINGVLSYCRRGRCYALDGSDLCAFLGYPCARGG